MKLTEKFRSAPYNLGSLSPNKSDSEGLPLVLRTRFAVDTGVEKQREGVVGTCVRTLTRRKLTRILEVPTLFPMNHRQRDTAAGDRESIF